MSTKTIAVETSVYDRLAREKRPSESFTKAIDRLLDSAAVPTCAAAVAGAAAVWGRVGSGAEVEAEAEVMDRVVAENRAGATWDVERPD
jgi:hypothetical protein